ncbi:MAG: PaaI family thioesterase [Deltaproteobacteria bacterium]|nr:PaaI family thioesterase [Deltaproteobacteria bacterium]
MSKLQDHINSAKRTGNIEFFIEERNEEFVISSMPVNPGILNPFGTVQAGALIWLADVTASVLAITAHTVGEDGIGFPLAIDIHTTLVSNQMDGEIKAEARFVRSGKNVLVIRTRITGNGDRLLAEVTSTHIPAK